MPVRTRNHHRAARVLQTCYRRRYRHFLANWDDVDPITRMPVFTIPRKRLFLLDADDEGSAALPHGFDIVSLLQWVLQTPVHPLTRKPLKVRLLRRIYRRARRCVPVDAAEGLRRGRVPVHMSEDRNGPRSTSIQVDVSPLFHVSRITIRILLTEEHQIATSMHYEVQNDSGIPELEMLFPEEFFDDDEEEVPDQ